MSDQDEWRWADPSGQQRLVHTDELRAGLTSGAIPSNAPVWRVGWGSWQSAETVPELTTSALSAVNGVVLNIPPPPMHVVASQRAFEAASEGPPSSHAEPPGPPPPYVPAASAPTPSTRDPRGDGGRPSSPTPIGGITPHAGPASTRPTSTLLMNRAPDRASLTASSPPAPMSGSSLPTPLATRWQLDDRPTPFITLPPMSDRSDRPTPLGAPPSFSDAVTQVPPPPPRRAPAPAPMPVPVSAAPPPAVPRAVTPSPPNVRSAPPPPMVPSARPPLPGSAGPNANGHGSAKPPPPSPRLRPSSAPKNLKDLSQDEVEELSGSLLMDPADAIATLAPGRVPAVVVPPPAPSKPPPPVVSKPMPSVPAPPAAPTAPASMRQMNQTRQAHEMPVPPASSSRNLLEEAPEPWNEGEDLLPASDSKSGDDQVLSGSFLLAVGSALDVGEGLGLPPSDPVVPAAPPNGQAHAPAAVGPVGYLLTPPPAPTALGLGPSGSGSSAAGGARAPGDVAYGFPSSAAGEVRAASRILTPEPQHFAATAQGLGIPPELASAFPAPVPHPAQSLGDAGHAAAEDILPPYSDLEVPPAAADVTSRPPSSRRMAPPDPSSNTSVLHDLTKLQRAMPKWVLPLAAGSTALLLFAIVGAVVSHKSDSSEQAAASASASAVSALSAAVVAAPTPSASATAPKSAALATCGVAGPSQVIAPRALVPIGIEAVATTDAAYLAFASASKEASLVQLDATSLAVGKTLRTKAPEIVRRATPMLSSTKPVALAADSDRKADKIKSRRTVNPTAPFDIGVMGDSLAWAPHGSDVATELWALEARGDAKLAVAEALRIANFGAASYAVAFRRENALWFGTFRGADTFVADGPLVKVPGMGPQMGAPAVAAMGDRLLVAWADRATTNDLWSVRLGRWKRGDAAPDMKPFEPPAGGLGEHAMSPALAALPGGGFLFAWTEGPVSNHQVRAITLDADGVPVGAPIVVSAAGVNAGQAQIAITPGGRGVVAFLAANGKAYEVVATPVACGKSSM